MDAPIKLYFTENEAALDIYSKKCTSLDIEYTRTDAFIEKATEWIEKNFNMPDDFKEHFKKAMKV